MSGGSFNYLHHAEGLEELMRKRNDLQDMRTAMATHEFTEEVGDATQELIDVLDRADKEIKQKIYELKDVWHAFEYWYSADWGRGEVEDAIQDRKAKMGVDPTSS